MSHNTIVTSSSMMSSNCIELIGSLEYFVFKISISFLSLSRKPNKLLLSLSRSSLFDYIEIQNIFKDNKKKKRKKSNKQNCILTSSFCIELSKEEVILIYSWIWDNLSSTFALGGNDTFVCKRGRLWGEGAWRGEPFGILDIAELYVSLFLDNEFKICCDSLNDVSDSELGMTTPTIKIHKLINYKLYEYL